MAAPIVLYDYWRSSAAYRVRIGLALKGLAYQRIKVDLLAGAQNGAAHLARNPQGLLPVLAIDDQHLTQSLAILDYLEETRPLPPLLPPDAMGRAKVRAISLAIACEIHPISNLNLLTRVEALAGAEAKANWNRDNISRGLAAVEQLIAPGFSGSYCYGDQPGMADCVLIPQLYNASRWGVDFAHLPAISRISARCAQHPAFQVAHPDAIGPGD